MNYMTKQEQSGFALRPTSLRMREACAHPFRANSQVCPVAPCDRDLKLALYVLSRLHRPEQQAN